MNFDTYLQLFETILHNPQPPAPYDHPDYLEYTRLNFSRTKRWMKTVALNKDLLAHVRNGPQVQQWIVIVEPWCGDVPATLPIIIKLAEAAPQVMYDIQLRDSEPFLINQYLTGSSKSIPKLIIRNAAGKDLAVWGPRPAGAQAVVDQLKAEGADFERLKTELQQWYNNDAGSTMQQELLQLLQTT